MKCYNVSSGVHLYVCSDAALLASDFRENDYHGIHLKEERPLTDEELSDFLDRISEEDVEEGEGEVPKEVMECIYRALPDMEDKHRVLSWSFTSILDWLTLDPKQREEKKKLQEEIKNEKPLFQFLEKKLSKDSNILDHFEKAIRTKKWKVENFDDLAAALKIDSNWDKILKQDNMTTIKGLVASGDKLFPEINPEDWANAVADEDGEKSDMETNLLNKIKGKVDGVTKVEILTEDTPPRVALEVPFSGIFKVIATLKLKYTDIELKY